MKNDNNSSVKKGISVLVSRAGDVIPQVMKRIFDDDIEAGITAYDGLISLDPPKACPACGSPTSFEFLSTPSKKSKRKKVEPQVNDMDALDEEVDDANDTESGQVLRCSGPQLLCQPRAVNAMAYAYSRPGLDIKGLSKAKLQQLMEEQIIRFPVDLFVAFGNKSSGESSRRTGEDMNGYDTP
jgi:NAD-dependent DNA ligase